jgi:hypothetical protein
MSRLFKIVAVLFCLGLGAFWLPTSAQTPTPKQSDVAQNENDAATKQARDALQRIADLRAKLWKIDEEIALAEDGPKEERKEEEKFEAKKPESKGDIERRLRRAKELRIERPTVFAAMFAALKDAPDPLNAEDNLVLMRMLQQPIDTKGLQEKVKLKMVLEYFSDMFQGRLPIIVNQSAFATEADSFELDVYESDVSLPPIPRRMSAETALNLILAQVERDQYRAVFRIRRGYVEIVPANFITAKRLLIERVSARVQERPVEYALRDLSEQTGLTINLDPAIGKKAATLINVHFRNIALEDALVTVTEMAELKYVVLRDSVYVTLPSKVEAIEKEEKKREERRQDVKVKVVPAK